ncbi:MAG: nitroreductase family protein [Gammaproteobacteria bacterium]|nr:nitroreductase family protein [Gammaproteobacteria bacterium]
MEFSEVIRTTCAVRDFVPSTLPDATLKRILGQARFAPSGGNRQGWRVVVVRDPAARRSLSAIARPTIQSYTAQVNAGENPWNTIVPSRVTAAEAAATQVNSPLFENLDDVNLIPAVLVVAVDLSVVASFDRDLPRVGVISGASIYPFVWSLLLGARNEGYGGVLTTFVARDEPKVQALLNLPSHFAVAALVPIGRPRKQLTKLTRKPVEEFTRWDRWNDGTPFKVVE